MLLAYMSVGHDEHDPWAAARASQRDDVHRVLAPRERRCPRCGAPQSGAGRTCTSCGADMTARYAKRVPWRPLLYAGLAVLVVLAVAIPVIAGLRDDAAGERERAAEREAQLREAERARQVRDARPAEPTARRRPPARTRSSTGRRSSASARSGSRRTRAGASPRGRSTATSRARNARSCRRPRAAARPSRIRPLPRGATTAWR